MTNFYKFSHNSFRHPWISKFILGADQYQECISCKGWSWIANDLTAVLEKSTPPQKWTDIIGNGCMPELRILSEKCLESFEKEGLGKLPVKKVTISGLHGNYSDVPPYYVLISSEIIGASTDFEKSGYVDAKVCPTCQNVIFNYSLSEQKQNSSNYFPYVIKNWNGNPIFVIENQTNYVFCTEQTIECARKYHLTNFCFVPDFMVNGSKSCAFRGIDYKKVKWKAIVESWKHTEPSNQQPIRNIRSLTIHRLAGRATTLHELIRRLEKLSENANLKDADGETPLHWAALQNPHVTVLEYLISRGAKINECNNRGMTPFQQAAACNTVEHLKCLINAGAKIHTTDHHGQTPFHAASSRNVRVDVLDFLYHLNIAWLNLKDIDGMTPLHLATQYNPNPKILQFLIEHGADINACNNKGKKPIHCVLDDTKKRILLTVMGTQS
jgi:ankyrin repeat protein